MMAFVNPKKSLGQHFLSDKNIARKITSALTFKGYDQVLEIGPGMGVLTEFLLEKKNINISLVEIDKESTEYLRKRFPEISENILQQDFLQYPIDKKHFSPVAIIGNFPYNISSQIFFKILENRRLVTEVVCMLQKEVAERIASPPGSKIYGILSVLLQAFYKAEFLFNVGPQVFFPKPKVKSAVIRLSHKPDFILNCNEHLFSKVVKTAFNQRRKMLRNSLSAFIHNKEGTGMALSGKSTADANHNNKEILLSYRPEQLSADDFISLTRYIETGWGNKLPDETSAIIQSYNN